MAGMPYQVRGSRSDPPTPRTRHLTPALDTSTSTMPTDLDTLTKAVMASLHQPDEKATAWVSALNQSLITEKVQLVGLLQFDHTEKEAGRGGCSAWRVAISALGQAEIGEVAWPVVEATHYLWCNGDLLAKR